MIYFVSLKDLSSIEGRDLASGTEAEVITRLREVYDFLPKETQISVKDGNVRIDIPEQVIANKLEATRLQEKASQRAKQGEYQKAAGIFSRVLELDPTNVKARRDLGMTSVRASRKLRLLRSRSFSIVRKCRMRALVQCFRPHASTTKRLPRASRRHTPNVAIERLKRIRSTSKIFPVTPSRSSAAR